MTVQSPKVIDSVLDSIGNTPLVKLNTRGTKASIFDNLKANLYAKMEFLNPSGSIKDRIIKHMLEQAEKRGELKPGMTIVEPTTGNTGISLAMIGCLKGYKVVVVMPENQTVERVQMMQAYGAEIVLTKAEELTAGSVEKALELSKQDGWITLNQFSNSDNVEAHRLTTGKEILEQVPHGLVHAFVAGIGTAGTIMGVSKALKAKNPDVRIIAAQPGGSQELTGGQPHKHIVEGIADGFIPKILDKSVIDKIITVRDREAVRFARLLAKEKGLFCGPSSGCCLYAAYRVALELTEEQNVVTILADSGDRYLSLNLFGEGDVKLPPGCSPL